MVRREIDDTSFVAGCWPLLPDRPTIVFIHGAGMNSAFWGSQVDGLAKDFNTIAPDLPGHGKSRGRGRDTVPETADAVLAFLDRLEISKPVLCGLSMGGAIVQELLIRDSSRFAGGILMNTGARLKVMPLIFETIERDYGEFIDMLCGFAVAKENDSPELRQTIHTACQCEPEVALGDFRACNGFDVMDRLHHIKVPVLVLSADQDLMTPVKFSTYLAGSIPGAGHVTIESAGHLSPIEKPEEVNSAISGFIAGLDL